MENWYALTLECEGKHRELLREAARERLAASVLRSKWPTAQVRAALAIGVDLAIILGPMVLILVALTL